MKNVQIRSFFWFKYGKTRTRKSPYLDTLPTVAIWIFLMSRLFFSHSLNYKLHKRIAYVAHLPLRKYWRKSSFKDLLSCLRQFLRIDYPLKINKSSFYFVLKTLFDLRYLYFCPDLFGHVGKWLDQKAKIKFKIHDVTGWETNNYNTHIAQYLRK